MPKKTIFISYSRKDKRWLDELRTMLAPLVGSELVELWWDGEIQPSQSWQEEIDRALAAAVKG